MMSPCIWHLGIQLDCVYNTSHVSIDRLQMNCWVTSPHLIPVDMKIQFSREFPKLREILWIISFYLAHQRPASIVCPEILMVAQSLYCIDIKYFEYYPTFLLEFW